MQVLDATGASIGPATRLMPLPAGAFTRRECFSPETLNGPDGHRQRAVVRRRTSGASDYYVATGVPLTQALEQWRTLLRVSLIGLPLALLFAAGAGGRMVRTAAHGEDRRRSAGDHREDRQPPDRSQVDHRARSPGRLGLQPRARSTEQRVDHPAAVHG